MGILNVFKKEEPAEEPAPKEEMIKCSQCGKEIPNRKSKKLGKSRVCKKCHQLARMASGANYR